MAWTPLHDNYAVNDETATVICRAMRTTGFFDDSYRVCDDPLTRSTNRGVSFATFDDRVAAGERGGIRRVSFPMGMSYEDVVDAIRVYGRIR